MQTQQTSASSTDFSAHSETTAEPEAWRVLAQTEDHSEYARAWTSLVARAANGVALVILLLGPADGGPFEVVAQYPEDVDAEGLLARAGQVLRVAIERRRPTIEQSEAATSVIAYPLLFAGRLHGVALAEGRADDANLARRILRHLQWSAAGLEAFFGRSAHREADALAERARFLVASVDAVAAASKGVDAARAIANSLAKRFDCESVAVGRYRRHRSRLIAVSQSALIERRNSLARAIESAQNEAIDQGAPLAAPADENSATLAIAAHEKLSRTLNKAHVLTVPLFARDRAVGAVTLRREAAFSVADVDLIDGLGAAVGALLDDKWRSDRSLLALAWGRGAGLLGEVIGPRRLGLKLVALIIVAAAAYLALATDVYRVRAHAQIQGETRRMASAPFDGFIRAQFARAGDVVAANAPLAELETSDIELDRLRQIAKKRQYQLDLDKALAKPDLAEINIARAQIDEADAEINLSEQMIARATLRAPFAAVVVSGDLSQSVGRPVSRGDVLFELAPLDRYRMNAVAPESDIGFVKPGQHGELLLSALPGKTFAFDIASIASVAQAGEGVNGFEVIAPITGTGESLRPGMEGVAKIDVGRRNVAWIWLHPIVDWARIKLWGLIP